MQKACSAQAEISLLPTSPSTNKPGILWSMVKADAALIGGTGIGALLGELGGQPFCIVTPFGAVRGKLLSRWGHTLAILQRHSPGHKLPPHKVPYAALGSALSQLEVEFCLATAAVGSLRQDWPPGTMAACKGFIDMTGRQVTRFEGVPSHVDVTESMSASTYLCQAASIVGERIHDGAVYIGMNGPRYETPAEIRMIKEMGGDVVGMTASSEAIALAENGVRYGCLAVVTNMGAGITSGFLSHEEVVDVMSEKGPKVLEILFNAIEMGLADSPSALEA